jgi:hypothetical protein
MSVSTLSPVSGGVYTALNVGGLTSLLGAGGGPHNTEVPQEAVFPSCWFVVTEQNARGMGTVGPSRIDLRVHASAVGSASLGVAKQLQGILSAVRSLLEDATLTVTGYRMAGQVVYTMTTEPFESEVGGKPCWEAVANFYLWVEP